ncbi:MAG: hypothetical protein NTY48_00900 [Candidatus Diapherotrites archaeon]|nr:hypothetical protein [Candidatus Diapherotrites archaeon]
MLGFIMSKMQMLLFAVGVSVVALMFIFFVSNIDLGQKGYMMLASNSKLVSDQLTNDIPCSFKTSTIPDRFYYGLSSTPFFYDLELSSKRFGEDVAGGEQNVLIMRIVEHSNSPNAKKNVIASKSISTDARIVLISPEFLKELSGLNELTYDVQSDMQPVVLYPRAYLKGELKASSPNAFAAVKETIKGQKTVYIIPCATEKEPNNCLLNILRVGCYKLKVSGRISPDQQVDDCLNPQVFASNSTSASTTSIQQSRNYSWADCQRLGYS